MEYCTICMKKVEDQKSDLCKNCNKKRGAAKIVLELIKNIDFKQKFSKKTLLKMGIKDKIRSNHYIWSLEECNLISKEKNYYLWTSEEEIIKFVEKYGDKKDTPIKKHLEIKKSNTMTCQRCGKEITTPNKKSKYCKKCKKINKTLKNIKKIEKIVTTDTPFTIDQIVEQTNQESWKIEGIIWDLQENDLIQTNEKEELILSEDKVNKFKEKNENQTQNAKTLPNTTPITEKTNNESNTNKKSEKQIETTKTPEKEIAEKPVSRIARHITKIPNENIQDENEDETPSNNDTNIEEKFKEKPADDSRNEPIKENITDLKSDNIKNKIKDYLRNYVQVHNRAVTDDDVTSTDIFNNFNSYLKEKSNQIIIDEIGFIKEFTRELFKVYPKAYRRFIKNGKNEIIRYNITLKYQIKEPVQEENTPTEEENSKNKDDLIFNEPDEEKMNVIKSYIENKLNILDRNPNNKDITQRDIILNFELYTKNSKYNIETREFLEIFRQIAPTYNIKNIFHLGRIKYNVKFKKDIKRPIDTISDEEKEFHIQKTLNNNQKSKIENKNEDTETSQEVLTKEIPSKIFAASYDEKAIIFIKSRIQTEKLNNVLTLINRTKNSINNVTINKHDDGSLNISLEYIVNPEEKGELIKLIQEYSWD